MKRAPLKTDGDMVACLVPPDDGEHEDPGSLLDYQRRMSIDGAEFEDYDFRHDRNRWVLTCRDDIVADGEFDPRSPVTRWLTPEDSYLNPMTGHGFYSGGPGRDKSRVKG